MNDGTDEQQLSDSMPATSKTQNMIEGAIAVGVVAWAMWKSIRMVTKHARETQASGVSRQDNTRDHSNTGSPQPAVAVNIETLINQAYERVELVRLVTVSSRQRRPTVYYPTSQ